MSEILSEAREIIERVLSSGRASLLETEAKALIGLFGISTPDFVLAETVEDAVEAAEHLGFPLVLKIVSPDVVHKTDVGGVKIGVNSIEQVREKYEEIVGSVSEKVPNAKISGILVQKMAPLTTELVIGAIRDPQFGPTVMFGMGGVFIELLKDVSFRVAPVNLEEAMDMIREIRGHPLLTGYRSSPSLDVAAVADAIVQVSKIITGIPEIDQMDLNPVLVYRSGISVVDARIILRKEA